MRPTSEGSRPAASSGVGRSDSSTPGAWREHLGHLGEVEGPLELEVQRGRVAGVDGDADAGAAEREVGQAEDLAALVAVLLLLVRLARAVVDEAAGQREHVEGDRARKRRRGGDLDGTAVEGEGARALGHLADLLVELGDASEARARDGLVGGDDHAVEPGEAVERLQHRHRHHRRAVRVGDDALSDLAERLAVDLGHDERDVGVHPPGRGVVDDDRPGGGHLRREGARRARPAGEQRDVEPGEVRRGDVLDGDLVAPPVERAAG